MPRTDLFLKVQIEHDPEEKPPELAEEICRRLLRLHGVRLAELSSYLTHPEPDSAVPSA